MNGKDQRLEIIAALLQRSAIYRAISARAALITGSLSILVALFIHLNNDGVFTIGHAIRPREFVVIWFIVFLIGADATCFLLWREAKRSGRAFFSAELIFGLNAIGPNLIIPAAFTIWFYLFGYLGARELDLVTVWIAFYGLTLISTMSFAPRSVAFLGWAFLLTALAVPSALDLLGINFSADLPNSLIGVTFGFYHLVYAALNWSKNPSI